MPFSLQYIMRLYLTSAGIFSFCFKDYPANWMSTCFHHCIVKKKKRKKEEEDEAANDSAETNYSPNFPFEIPARRGAPTFFNSSYGIGITRLIFCLRVNFMEHLGIARHYEEMADTFAAILKRDNKNLPFVFILGCCSKCQPPAGGI